MRVYQGSNFLKTQHNKYTYQHGQKVTSLSTQAQSIVGLENKVTMQEEAQRDVQSELSQCGDKLRLEQATIARLRQEEKKALSQQNEDTLHQNKLYRYLSAILLLIFLVIVVVGILLDEQALFLGFLIGTPIALLAGMMWKRSTRLPHQTQKIPAYTQKIGIAIGRLKKVRQAENALKSKQKRVQQTLANYRSELRAAKKAVQQSEKELHALKRKQSNFEMGIKGEERIATLLGQLLDDSWTLYRNVGLEITDDNKADIDAVLVGPTGVFALEVKNYTTAYRHIGQRWESKQRGQWKEQENNPITQIERGATRLQAYLRRSNANVNVLARIAWVGTGEIELLNRPKILFWFPARIDFILQDIQRGKAIDQQMIQFVNNALRVRMQES